MSFYSDDELAEIRNNSDLVIYASEELVLKKKGGNYVSLCPFHSEKTPSFTISPARQIFYCFGCGAGGDIFNYVMRQNGLSFPEAVEEIARRSGLEHLIKKHSKKSKDRRISPKSMSEEDLVYNPNSEFLSDILKILRIMNYKFKSELQTNASSGAQSAREYLKKRRIDNDIIDIFDIGYAPGNDVLFNEIYTNMRKEWNEEYVNKLLLFGGLVGSEGFRSYTNRITFPIKSVDGKVLGFNSRLTDSKKKNKYKNPSNNVVFDSKNILYGLDLLSLDKVQRDGLYIVEGHTDLFGFTRQNLNSALALGNSHLSIDQIELINALQPPKYT
jgi:DNA primase